MIFLEANKDAPFKVKKTVVDVCFNVSLLYGLEGWLGVKLSTTLNMKAGKMLLGVCQSIPNNTCRIEAGYPSIEATIRQRRRKFISRMKKERGNMYDDPLMFTLNIFECDNPRDIYQE